MMELDVTLENSGKNPHFTDKKMETPRVVIVYIFLRLLKDLATTNKRGLVYHLKCSTYFTQCP